MRSPCTQTKSSSHSPQLEKAHAQHRRPSTAKKIKKKKTNFKRYMIDRLRGEREREKVFCKDIRRGDKHSNTVH